MNVPLKKIVPNPHKMVREYPFDEDNIEHLMSTIQNTEFWQNIEARESPTQKGMYEIAYGHHRIEAARRLGMKTVPLTVKDMDNTAMLLKMADENSRNHGRSSVSVLETVRATKVYIDEQIQSNDFKDFNAQGRLSIVFDSKRQFENAKQYHGAGEATILKFLGKPWSKWSVREALATLYAAGVFQRPEDRKEKEQKKAEKKQAATTKTTPARKTETRKKPAKEQKLDLGAHQIFKSITSAKAFRTGVQRFKIKEERQKELAEELGKDATEHQVVRRLEKEARETLRKSKQKTLNRDPFLERLEKMVEDIEADTKRLSGKIGSFLSEMKQLEDPQIAGLSKVFTLRAIGKMLKRMDQYLRLFGHTSQKALKAGEEE